MIRRLNEYSGQTQLDRLGRLFDRLRDTDTEGLQGYMNEVLDGLSSFYFDMYKSGKATPAECVDFYDRVKPILESLQNALEDVISEGNVILTDKKYRDYLNVWRDSIS